MLLYDRYRLRELVQGKLANPFVRDGCIDQPEAIDGQVGQHLQRLVGKGLAA